MQHNVILAGVGGQGILTIAKGISAAALKRGMYVKQAEVHGMSQRGGSVQSHLRISTEPIHSDLVGTGQADVLIAVEPLEALRYLEYVSNDGVVVSSINAFVNIGNYPTVEGLLDKIARHPRHVLIDAERIARAAGSGRAANVAMLGATSLFLELEPTALEQVVVEMFERLGDNVVEANRRAFQFGRSVAAAYMDGLGRGGTSAAVRNWIESVQPEDLARAERPDAPVFEPAVVMDRLSGAEVHAVDRSLVAAYEEGRKQLFEHEVYSIVQLVGAISPPHHAFLSTEDLISPDALAQFPGDRVVLKIVSPDVVHKTDRFGIAFVRKDYDTVRQAVDRLVARHRGTADVRGVLVVEYVPMEQPGFGNELFVGVRATREFGPVIAAGLGGIDTEFLAKRMLPGVAVAKALATDTSAEEFLELFQQTVAYEILAGHARGRRRMVSDGELLRCFRAFIMLARHFCVDRGEVGPDVEELEVNPFSFRHQRMIPLDGRGRMRTAVKPRAVRPLAKVGRLLEPAGIGVVGVSSSEKNFGRIILNNVIASGFPPDSMRVVKPESDTLDGVACVPSIADLPDSTDLLVVATAAGQLPQLIDEIAGKPTIESVVIIPGGVGETDGSQERRNQVRAAIERARARPGGGPVFLGPNSLGVVSRPGGYDTFFTPHTKIEKRWGAPPRPVAIVSQSGAFIITRLSNLETLDPTFAVSIGNQLDVTVSDMVRVLGARDDVKVIGVYVEGFDDLDGLELLRAVRALSGAGKAVVFYKAGRTEQGQTAAAGHTTAVAGDYDICTAGAEQAGALVADSFKSFEQLLELCATLHGKRVRGLRVGMMSNAGFETVGMADSLTGNGYALRLAALSAGDLARLQALLERHGLGALVNARNPLDLTPMADQQTYLGAIQAMLASDEVDALVVGIVPLTSSLLTTAEEIEGADSLASALPAVLEGTDKPVLVSVDSGSLYDPFVRTLRNAGIPVSRSADEAMRTLGQYLTRRFQMEN